MHGNHPMHRMIFSSSVWMKSFTSSNATASLDAEAIAFRGVLGRHVVVAELDASEAG